MWRELGDLDELASALDSLGWPLVYDADDNPRALDAFEQSLELRRELGDAAGETRALVGIAQVLVAMGETERAEAISLELLERAARSAHGALRVPLPRRLRADPRRHRRGGSALPREPPGRAAARRRRRDELRGAGRGDVEAGAGNPRGAVILAVSVEALWESLGLSISVAFWDALLERYLAPARASLGDEHEAVRAKGRALAFDDAVELALREDA